MQDQPGDRSPAEHADWLDLMAKTAAETLEVDRERVFMAAVSSDPILTQVPLVYVFGHADD